MTMHAGDAYDAQVTLQNVLAFCIFIRKNGQINIRSTAWGQQCPNFLIRPHNAWLPVTWFSSSLTWK